MTKKQTADRTEAIATLREWIKPGDTIQTILDHVSSSGMSRAIRVVLPYVKTEDVPTDRPLIDFLHPNHAIGVVLGLRHWTRNGRTQDALIMGGCGTDMGFELVHHLSYALYPSYACLGKGKCPSNYHNNHRDNVRCKGTGDQFCYAEKLNGRYAYYLSQDDTATSPIVCPTCNGTGYLPNPEGPERFDLTHEDGYALRQRWL